MRKILKLNPKRISAEVVREAAITIRGGGVLLYPTETIYGLGCDVFNERAVKRIFAIKQRFEKKPLLVLVRNVTMVRELVVAIPPLASVLMDRFWPGPLTLIFYARRNISSLVTAGSGKIGVRIPKNNFCLRLIKACSTPIVSTSANISGQEPVQGVDDLVRHFGNRVDLVVNVGILPVSLPSTVVDVSDARPRIIREGAIRRIQLLKCF